jgi:hypothetical protein
LEDFGWGLEDLGTWDLGDLGTWELGNLGTWGFRLPISFEKSQCWARMDCVFIENTASEALSTGVSGCSGDEINNY